MGERAGCAGWLVRRSRSAIRSSSPMSMISIRSRSVRSSSLRCRAFIPDPVAELELSLPSSLAAELETASAAVRTLNASPPKLAALEAVARHLLRQESTASSRIEGLALGHRRIALTDFDLEGSEDHKAADIAGNIRAMAQAVQFGETVPQIKPEHIKAIHRTLLRFGVDEAIAGKWRDEQGWIGGSSPIKAPTYLLHTRKSSG